MGRHNGSSNRLVIVAEQNGNIDWGTRPAWAITLLVIEAHQRLLGYGPSYREIATWANRTSKTWAMNAVTVATMKGYIEQRSRYTHRAYELTALGMGWVKRHPAPSELERWLRLTAAAIARAERGSVN